jgi:hypothetical protein
MHTQGNPVSVPQETPIELVDNDPLEQPVDAEFRTGVMSSWLGPVNRAVIVIEAYLPCWSMAARDHSNRTDRIAFEPRRCCWCGIPVGTARAFREAHPRGGGRGRPICPLAARRLTQVPSTPGDL